MRAGRAYFVSFQQAAKDFAQLAQATLTLPVLVIGGEKASGELLAQQMKRLGSVPLAAGLARAQRMAVVSIPSAFPHRAAPGFSGQMLACGTPARRVAST
jgi:hypothetical protein